MREDIFSDFLHVVRSVPSGGKQVCGMMNLHFLANRKTREKCSHMTKISCFAVYELPIDIIDGGISMLVLHLILSLR